MLSAVLEAVAHDGEVTPDEGSVVRAIAMALDCPIPPLVSAVDEVSADAA